MRDELALPRMIANQSRLPRKILGHQASLKLGEGRGDAGIDRAIHGWKVCPVIDPVAPVIEAELLVHGGEIGVALSHPLYKGGLHVGAARVVCLGLIVHLVADDRGMIFDMVDQGDDDLLRSLPKRRIRNVHVLAAAVFGRSLGSDDENLRMLPCQPRGDRIGRRSHDDLDAGLVHGGEHAIYVAKVEDAWLRFQRAPGRLGDAHNGDPGGLHHAHVFIQTVCRGVLLVVGGTEEDRLRTLADCAMVGKVLVVEISDDSSERQQPICASWDSSTPNLIDIRESRNYAQSGSCTGKQPGD